MNMITLLLALSLQEVRPTDKEVDEALQKLKAALAESGEEGQIDALREALQIRHEKIIKAVGSILTSGTEKVRIGAALALGDVDHPASVDALIAAVSPNTKTATVLAAIAESLGKLGWEKGVAPLHELVKKVGDDVVRDALPQVLAALGQIGSPASVDPLYDFLRKLKGPRRDPWPNTNELIRAGEQALKAVTGGDASKINEFDDWWKDNKGSLTANAKKTYWVKKTAERVTVGPGERAPADSLLLGTRLVEPAQPKEKGGKKKKGP